MALIVYWYDFVCFGIVVAAFIGSLYVLWRRELVVRRNEVNVESIYESLLVASDHDDEGVLYTALPTHHVGSAKLWTTCWKGVHPGWLFATRLGSFLGMAGFLAWDIIVWDYTVFVYYTEWQTPVCAFIVIVPAFVATSYTTKTVKKPDDSLCFHDLWKPCWRHINPFWLLLYRVLAYVFLAPWLYQEVQLNGAFAFFFYTQWTFALVMVYFALASVVSAYGCWMSLTKPLPENGTTVEYLKRDVEENTTAASLTYREREITIKLQSQYAREAVQFRAGFWGYLMQAMYQTCGGAVIMTDIVFWCIIVPFGISTAHLRLNILMGCMHTLNLVFLLIDTGLNSMPFPWFRIAYFIQWSCLYILFQWVIHACGVTWWPYPFLELDVPWAPLWYFSLAVIHIPCYGAYALIAKAKNSLLTKKFPHSFLRSC